MAKYCINLFPGITHQPDKLWLRHLLVEGFLQKRVRLFIDFRRKG